VIRHLPYVSLMTPAQWNAEIVGTRLTGLQDVDSDGH
jgi:hypothetical protein